MEKVWWKEAVAYQVYPRSFYDSNGDGIGDLPGLTEKLPYIRDLGVDVLWLCPIFASPCRDDGYDIADHQNILPEFGTMEDFYTLLKTAHSYGLRVMLEMEISTTSEEHPWFQSSRLSRRALKRDFYIWRTPNWGDPPNNWSCYYGDSAWTYDEKTEQSFLHLFSKHRPELNWENYKLRQEVYDSMIWWLDMGVDGVRLPNLQLLVKPDGLPDAEGKSSAPGWERPRELFENQPDTHQYLREMRRKLTRSYEVLMAGEAKNVNLQQARDYSGEARGEMDILFQNEHLLVDYGPGGRYDLQSLDLFKLKNILSKWQMGMQEDGWQALYFGSPDQPRMVSRFGDDSPEYRERSAKMLATILLTLKGTPFIYQGDEIGMTNGTFSEIEECHDLESKTYYARMMREEDAKPSRVMNVLSTRGRDSARTPMQWSISRSSGFTTADPWIKVNPNHGRLNVSLNESDDYSVLKYYRRAIALRKQYKTLVYGKYVPLDDMNSQHYSYLRTDKEGTFLVLINFTRGRIFFTTPLVLRGKSVERVLSNYEKEDAKGDSERIQQYVSTLFHPDREQDDGRFFTLSNEVQLRPYEANVLKLR